MTENNPAVWTPTNWSRKQAPGLAQFAADNKDSFSKADPEHQMDFQAKWGELAPGVPFPFAIAGSYIEPKKDDTRQSKPSSGQVQKTGQKVKTWTCDRKCYGDSGKLYKAGDQLICLVPPSDYFTDEDGKRRPGANPKMVGSGKKGRKVNHPLIKVPKKHASPSDIDAIKEMLRNNAEPDNIAKTLNIDPALVVAIIDM
jgi:hypothetical protein